MRYFTPYYYADSHFTLLATGVLAVDSAGTELSGSGFVASTIVRAREGVPWPRQREVSRGILSVVGASAEMIASGIVEWRRIIGVANCAGVNARLRAEGSMLWADDETLVLLGAI